MQVSSVLILSAQKNAFLLTINQNNTPAASILKQCKPDVHRNWQHHDYFIIPYFVVLKRGDTKNYLYTKFCKVKKKEVGEKDNVFVEAILSREKQAGGSLAILVEKRYNKTVDDLFRRFVFTDRKDSLSC